MYNFLKHTHSFILKLFKYNVYVMLYNRIHVITIFLLLSHIFFSTTFTGGIQSFPLRLTLKWVHSLDRLLPWKLPLTVATDPWAVNVRGVLSNNQS